MKDWHRIAAKIPNRTNKDCRKRWVNKVRGGLRSGPWSEAEDQKLRDAVEKYGQRWVQSNKLLAPSVPAAVWCAVRRARCRPSCTDPSE